MHTGGVNTGKVYLFTENRGLAGASVISGRGMVFPFAHIVEFFLTADSESLSNGAKLWPEAGDLNLAVNLNFLLKILNFQLIS